MAQTLLFNEHCHFSFDGRNYCIGVYSTVGITIALMSQSGNSHTFEVLRVLYQTGDLANIPDIGTFIINKLPQWNPIIAAALTNNPNYDPIENKPPKTMRDIALALYQYFRAVPTPDGGAMQLEFKPYEKPNP